MMKKKLSGLGLLVASVILLASCGKNNDVFSDSVRHQLWLSYLGADLPITVEGNTNSREFLILAHGGPGGSAQEFNTFTSTFADVLEVDHAMVYYDQRAAGISRGEYNPALSTVLQHVDDLSQVIKLLKERYGDDIKVALMGHSWGGYLTCAYLLDPDRAATVDVWVNIDGGVHRTNFLKDDMQRIIDLADEEIQAGRDVERWSTVRSEANSELNRNINPYSFDSQSEPFRILTRAESIIADAGHITNTVSSTFDAIYLNNYQPFIASGNDFRDAEMIQQDMFDFDFVVDSEISNITLPTLSIYGFWDVRTALQQGQYVMDSISTPEAQKSFIILEDSGHSPMVNEPILLAETILDWLEDHL